jgi:hypothetical protein
MTTTPHIPPARQGVLEDNRNAFTRAWYLFFQSAQSILAAANSATAATDELLLRDTNFDVAEVQATLNAVVGELQALRVELSGIRELVYEQNKLIDGIAQGVVL